MCSGLVVCLDGSDMPKVALMYHDVASEFVLQLSFAAIYADSRWHGLHVARTALRPTLCQGLCL